MTTNFNHVDDDDLIAHMEEAIEFGYSWPKTARAQLMARLQDRLSQERVAYTQQQLRGILLRLESVCAEVDVFNAYEARDMVRDLIDAVRRQMTEP